MYKQCIGWSDNIGSVIVFLKWPASSYSYWANSSGHSLWLNKIIKKKEKVLRIGKHSFPSRKPCNVILDHDCNMEIKLQVLFLHVESNKCIMQRFTGGKDKLFQDSTRLSINSTSPVLSSYLASKLNMKISIIISALFSKILLGKFISNYVILKFLRLIIKRH